VAHQKYPFVIDIIKATLFNSDLLKEIAKIQNILTNPDGSVQDSLEDVSQLYE